MLAQIMLFLLLPFNSPNTLVGTILSVAQMTYLVVYLNFTIGVI